MMDSAWCLVLVVWGYTYSDDHVNIIALRAKKKSKGLEKIILVTDRIRPGVVEGVEQKLFPEFFRNSDLFRPGYPAKLVLFHRDIVPPDTPCIYLDLDTIVLGDLSGLVAALRTKNDIMMLPPGNLFGFGLLRRLFFVVTGGRKFAIGNSSIVVFHSGGDRDLCTMYEDRFRREGLQSREMYVDDRFISKFAQLRLRAVPAKLAVMFRREFMSRSRIALWMKSRLPWVIARRSRLVAITFNGAEHKPENFAFLQEGTLLYDRKGRRGIWREPEMQPLRKIIADVAQELARKARKMPIRHK